MQNFIQSHLEKIEPLETANRLAWWNLATTGDQTYAQEFEKTQIALRKLYSSSEEYQFLLSTPPLSDPLLNRQMTLLLHRYVENQVPPEMIEQMVKLETEIESIYTNFRPMLEGCSLSNNDLKAVFVNSSDSLERQKAWEASKLIGEQVEERVLKLVALRNRGAQQVGFPNYYSMRLELQELDENLLFDLLDQLDYSTAPHWQSYKANLDKMLGDRYAVSPSSLMPWHYQDPFFQEAPNQQMDFDRFYTGQNIANISRHFYQSIGLPVEDILERSDLYERENKNQHAFCLCIDQKQDVRILCNLRDDEYWMSTQLHELGHAVYDKYIDQALPYLLRAPAHTSSTEAIAMLFGRLSNDVDFLRHYASFEEESAEELRREAIRQSAANLLVFARWTLVMVHFERALYQQPTTPLNQLWWEYVERFQSLNRIPFRNKPDWAAKLHLACAPVYYQNYILGEMTASQLTHALKKFLIPFNETLCCSPRVGHWLKNRLFSLGAQFPWGETVRRATGESLNPHYFALDTAV